MSKPSNVCIEFDDQIKSLDHLIRKFMRECKKEGVIKEHLSQYVYETRGQRQRRKKREGRSRHLRSQKRPEDPSRKRPKQY